MCSDGKSALIPKTAESDIADSSMFSISDIRFLFDVEDEFPDFIPEGFALAVG